jgi:integration host factor subunit alpha
MTLTKADLIHHVFTSLPGYTKTQAREAVETLLKIMKSSLEKGDDVMLSGFGKFKVRDKQPRKGRNPKTGEEIMIDARRVVTFKPSGKLKDKINGE